MKTLILYATKTGTTEKCAKLLAEKLENAEVYNLKNGEPDTEGYDMIIVGGSIRAGMLHRKAKKYIKEKCGQQKNKKTAFFVCCADSEKADEYLKSNIPADILERSVCSGGFGGEMDIDKQKGLMKFFLKRMRENAEKKGTSVPPAQILPENIERFAEKIKSI